MIKKIDKIILLVGLMGSGKIGQKAQSAFCRRRPGN